MAREVAQGFVSGSSSSSALRRVERNSSIVGRAISFWISSRSFRSALSSKVRAGELARTAYFFDELLLLAFESLLILRFRNLATTDIYLVAARSVEPDLK